RLPRALPGTDPLGLSQGLRRLVSVLRAARGGAARGGGRPRPARRRVARRRAARGRGPGGRGPHCALGHHPASRPSLCARLRAAAAKPLRDMTAAAVRLRALVPQGARVFLIGDSLIPYLAGITPYLQQIHSTNTLAVVQERRGIEKGGLWGDREMELWLTKDA